MIWKNIEIHNAAELVETDGGVTWTRVPGEIRETKNLHPQAVKRVFTAPTPRIQILSRSAAKEGDPWRKK